ncbi:ankyrin [Polychaeton citri CBS 116435]|uniref:Ankyrin n=1 Tax=Polychaeton citri CBS 116435 TaxID=1314669 RepID=A0A9P4Q5X8_9PEZI|nr:ankyrin [Polychaeton citri CBS 116435]
MHIIPALTSDEIDDLLYFVRVNEKQDLEQTIAGLSQKYQCSNKDVLEASVDPESGNTTLHYCAANGLSDLLPILLSHLQSHTSTTSNSKSPVSNFISQTNKEGNTPLHWGAYNGHLETVKQLVAAGGDIWAKNSAGHLAMFEAERADKADVVQFLLEAGGKEVEKAGIEGQAGADDVEDEDTEDHDGASSGVPVRSEDVEMR